MRMISLRDKRGEAEQEKGVNIILLLLVLVIGAIIVWGIYNLYKGGTFPFMLSDIAQTGQACSTACTTGEGAKYDYCTRVRSIKLTQDEFTALGVNKDSFTPAPTEKNRVVKATCLFLATNNDKLNWSISSCDNIEC